VKHGKDNTDIGERDYEDKVRGHHNLEGHQIDQVKHQEKGIGGFNTETKNIQQNDNYDPQIGQHHGNNLHDDKHHEARVGHTGVYEEKHHEVGAGGHDEKHHEVGVEHHKGGHKKHHNGEHEKHHEVGHEKHHDVGHHHEVGHEKHHDHHHVGVEHNTGGYNDTGVGYNIEGVGQQADGGFHDTNFLNNDERSNLKPFTKEIKIKEEVKRDGTRMVKTSETISPGANIETDRTGLHNDLGKEHHNVINEPLSGQHNNNFNNNDNEPRTGQNNNFNNKDNEPRTGQYNNNFNNNDNEPRTGQNNNNFNKNEQLTGQKNNNFNNNNDVRPNTGGVGFPDTGLGSRQTAAVEYTQQYKGDQSGYVIKTEEIRKNADGGRGFADPFRLHPE